MNRVLMNFTISLIVGIAFPHSLLAFLMITVLFVALYLFCYLKFKRHFVFTLALGFIVGVVLSSFAPRYDSGEIYKYEGESVTCVAVVKGVPMMTEKYTKFEAEIQSINGVETKEKSLIYVYDAENIPINHIICFDSIKFKLPDDQRNPGGFDYRKYLTGKEIFFVGTTNTENIKCSVPAVKTVLSEAARLNSWLASKIDNKLSQESAGLFKAILLGSKGNIDDEALGDFQNSGLSHIMAVSGLHLSIIVMLLNLFVKRLNRWVKFALSFVFVTIFAFTVGLPVSVIRAAVMLLLFLVIDAMFLEGDSLTNLSFAALVILIPNPNAVYDIGFVMSFSATFGILCLSDKFKKLMPQSMPSSIKESVCVTLSAQIATLPFSAMYFGQFSFLATISNLLIVILMPLIYLVGIPAVFTAWTPLVYITENLLALLFKWAKFCAKLPGQIQYIPINSVVISGLFMFTIVAMTTSVFKNKKIVSWLMIVALLLSSVGCIWQIKPVKGTEITFLNVGQADCALVRTKNSAFLVDTATEYMSESEITGYLLRQGLSKLDGIFISHFDTDHCGGVLKILEQIDTSALYIPDTSDVGFEQYKLLMYANNNKIPVFSLKKGDKVDFMGLEVTVLYPESKSVKDSENEASLVFRVDNEDVSVLFTGDLQKDDMLQNCDTDILKVSHHGSKNGTTEGLLKKCTPEISVISLAENNRYGFPHAELMKRLEKYSKEIYRTDLNKTVTVKCNSKNYIVNTMR